MIANLIEQNFAPFEDKERRLSSLGIERISVRGEKKKKE